MARIQHWGPTGDSDNQNRYMAGESNTGLAEDYCHPRRRLSNNQVDLRYDLSGLGSAGSAYAAISYRRFWIRVWRFPVASQTIWLMTGSGQASDALQLTISPTGLLTLYNRGNQAFPGEIIGSPGSVVLERWHQIRIGAKFNTLTWSSNDGWAEISLDGGDFIRGTGLNTGGGAGEGITYNAGSDHAAYRDVLGRQETDVPWLDIDYSNFVIDDAAYPVDSRITAVRCAATGTYQEFDVSGIADWRARNTWPGAVASQVCFTTARRTNTTAHKQTYLMESFAAAGIAGNILGAHLHVFFGSSVGTTPSIIVRRNGSDTITAMTWTPQAGQWVRYRLDTSGWASGDTLELGIQSGVGTTYLGAIVLSVEHDTAVPVVAAGTVTLASEITWTGNDTVQTVTLPSADPQMILWWPRSNATQGGLWLAEANCAHNFATPGASRPNLIVRGTSMYLVGAETTGANATGVVYDALVIYDPLMKMLCAGSYADDNYAGRDDRPVPMLDYAGLPFAPLTVIASRETTDTQTDYRYYGPGVTGDAALSLSSASAGVADYIQALTATGFTAGLSLHTQEQQTHYVGFRRSRMLNVYVLDCLTYIGNGAGGTRVIPVDVSGQTVRWAIVVPVSSASRAIRNGAQSNAYLFESGGTYANSITALGADSITVGTALNATDVVYSVLVFALGTDPGPVVPCAGGGTVASGTNPSAPASLADVTAPITYVEITPDGGSLVSFAMAGVPYGSPKTGVVAQFGSLARYLSDGDGGPRASVITSTFIDTSRYFRTLVSANVLRGALIEYYTADLATLKSGGDPTRRFRGRVASWSAEPGLVFSITSVDELTARLTSIDASDVQVPQRLLDNTVTDDTPSQRMFEAPAPEGYGNISDEDLDEPVGVWECRHVKSITIEGHEELGNVRAFLIMVQVGTRVQSLFAADILSGLDETDIVVRGRVPESAYGDWSTDDEAYFLKPGDDDYPSPDPWFDANNGRYWIIFGKDGHPVVELAVSGRIPLTCNFCGYETVGDGTGSTIASPARAFLHWLNNRVVQDATDDWLSIAALDDYSLFDTDTFEAVHDLLEALDYTVQGLIGSDFRQRSWREGVSEWCRNFGFDLGTNRHGQVILVYLDRTSDAAGATAFTPSDILERGCDVDMRADAVENEVRYVHSANYLTKIQEPNPAEGAIGLRQPFDGPWLSGRQIIQDSTSIEDLGGDPRGVRRSAVQEYGLVRDSDVADAVASERLALRSPAQGRAEVTFDLWLRDGDALELGDIVTVEHWDVPWAGARRCQVRALVTDLDTHQVTPTVRDVDDLLV